MFGGFDVAGGAFGVVLGNEVGDGGYIGSRLICEPVKATATYSWRSWFSSARSSVDMSMSGTESTGKPLR